MVTSFSVEFTEQAAGDLGEVHKSGRSSFLPDGSHAAMWADSMAGSACPLPAVALTVFTAV